VYGENIMTKITAHKGSRTERIGARLTRDEKQMLLDVLEQSGLSLSDWIAEKTVQSVVPAQNDAEIVKQVQNLIYQSEILRQGLYVRRPGCACDRYGLCALHAQVYDHLWDSNMYLMKAVRYIALEK
jgi:hypothetical protein